MDGVGDVTNAVVLGKPLETLPQDLYIPPDALEVFLEAFEGPLDLLLYLIKKQNLDILDIPVADITKQYMKYIEMMQHLRLELAAEYLVMAAMLAEIKSRILLPRPVAMEEEEDDPRAELIRRLQEYERFKKVAEDIDSLPRLNRDFFLVAAETPPMENSRPLPQVELKDLWYALQDVLEQAEMYRDHQVQREPLSTRERMAKILLSLPSGKFTGFAELFTLSEGRTGVVVTFAAILELLRQSMIEMVQADAYAPYTY